MTDDRLDRIAAVYHDALERDERDRPAFVRDACAGDEQLRREVEALLKYDGMASQFIEEPAVVVARVQDVEGSRNPSSLVGRQIGPYTLVSVAGSGGMGDVFLAHDVRLARDVAVKLLPRTWADDAARRARFEREARLLAALNHPNIAQLHGLEQSGDLQAIVMEWVPGPTIADLIARGPISVKETLAIAAQIAHAVDAAHENGVLHRDLKPANIKVRPDGVVKVLDFGLAKPYAVGPATAEPSVVPTSEGVILGTAPYMSPEQIRGVGVDKRTDVWAFGCVLYEMLTGRPAYHGVTSADTLAAILDGEPDWDRLPASLPPRLPGLLRHCLAKDPRRRLRDIGDAVAELESIDIGSTRPHAASAPAATRAHVWKAVAFVTTAIAIVAAAAWALRPSAPPSRISFTVSAPPAHEFAALPTGMSISPDGRMLAFVTTAGGRNQLWVRALDSVTPRLLVAEGAWQPAWAPDSRSLVFTESVAGGRLRRVDLENGAVTMLANVSRAGASSWGRGGVILYTGDDGRLYRLPDRGGEATKIFELDRARQELLHAAPQFLPDGRRFVFLAISQDASKNALYVGDVDGSRRTHLLDGLTRGSYSSGYLFYQRAGTLMARPFDHQTGVFTGEPIPTVDNLLTVERGAAAFSVADNGTLAYRAAGTSGSTLAWFDREGRRVATIDASAADEHPRLSPDGRSLAVSRSDRGQHDIWIIDLERNVANRLTTDPAVDDYPVWSADGRRVIFASNRNGPDDVYWRAADGSGTDDLLYASSAVKRPTHVSASGTLLFTVRTGPGSNTLDIWGLPLVGARAATPVIASPSINEYNGMFSPDGRWIVYTSNESGAPQISLQAFPAGGRRIRVSTSMAAFPQWSGDGREIFFNSVSHLNTVDVSTPDKPGPSRQLFPWPFRESWTVDATGQRFLRRVGSDVDTDEPITIVVNWASGLAARR